MNHCLSSSPSSKYDKRQNRGETVESWGDLTSVKWRSRRKEAVEVNVEGSALGPNTKYMFQKAVDKMAGKEKSRLKKPLK